MAHTVHVDEMLAEMTIAEFDEWCLKDAVEPIGHAGTHEILSQIAAMLAQYMGVKDADPWTYKWWQDRPQKQAEADNAAMILETAGWRRG